MEKPILKKRKEETVGETFEVLPDDYNNWSSTVIFFTNCCADDEVNVYALNCDDCVVYYVVSYQRGRSVWKSLGYTAGDFKVYFVGNIIYDEETDYGPKHSTKVDVYDIRNRLWITDDFPELNAPKPGSFVFFLDERLYVLSGAVSSCWPVGTRFEMLDIKNLSQGWVFLPEPYFSQSVIWAHLGYSMIDYSDKMLYVRVDECATDFYGYNLQDNVWHDNGHDGLGSLRGCSGDLLRNSCYSDSVIGDKYSYTFQMLKYPDGKRATIIIRDLEYDSNDGDDPPVEGFWKVDISSVISRDVHRDLAVHSCLAYLGKRNSCQRISLIITYRCQSGFLAFHLWTCTFDLSRIGENSTESFVYKVICSRQYQHIKMNDRVYICRKIIM